METVSQSQLAEACGLLFGENFSYSTDTLKYLEPSGIKQAFRTRVKSCHPDLNPELQKGALSPSRDFIRLKEAYDFLLDMKRGREPDFSPSAPPGTEYGFRSPATLPRRSLRIGEYLYYSGRISWNELIEGISWQKRTRPKLGELAVRKKLLKKDQVDKILTYCRKRKDGNRPDLQFGEAALLLGLLDSVMLNRLLSNQRCLNPLGSYYCRKEILSRQELVISLLELNRHNGFYTRKS